MIEKLSAMKWLQPLKGVPKENVLMAMATLRANKFRSFLTTLGVVIGVMTVVVIASILTGMRKNIIILIEQYGTNNIYAFHLTTGPHLGPRDRKEWARKPLTIDDSQAILEQAPAVDTVAYVSFVWWLDKNMTYGPNNYKQGNLNSVSANYGDVTNVAMRDGRFFTDFDDLHRRDVIVIGIDVYDALFPMGNSALGKEVLMGGRKYEVVGVMEKKKGNFFGESDNNEIFIPYRTSLKLAPKQDFLMLNIRAKSGQLQKAMEQVEQILRRRRGVKFNEENNFDLSTADRIIKQFDEITATLGIIAIAISGVGLLVGGIGVMNIMLVSVTERTREIGVRKAIGARRRDIVTQFLFEAMTLTSVGGFIGIILSFITSFILLFLLPNLPSTIPLWAVIAGLSVSIFVGLVFGVWPARVASQLDPIECLRYE
jgi:putative ABC transport system permease protein